nr:hypothetical protein [Tanacetum cinerariifolium]
MHLMSMIKGRIRVDFFYQRTLNVVPKHVEMHLMLKNQAGKKMATYNLNGFVWALKDSITILKLTPMDKELKETWLIGSLSYIRGADVPFIQSVKAVKNEDQATIRSKETVAIDDNIPTCPTDSNTLLEDVDSLFKEVIDVRLDLVGRVGELRTKIVQTLASTVSTKETVVGNSFNASLKPNNSNGDQINFYYQESQQGSLQHLVKEMEQVMSSDVSCLKPDKLDEQQLNDALQDNAEANLDETLKDNAEMVDTIDNEDGISCLDDMFIGFEEYHLNGEIKVSLYQNDHIPLDETMDVAVKDTSIVTDSSPVVETIVIDNTFKNKKVNLDQCITDVMDAENNIVGLDTPLLKHGFGLAEKKRKPENKVEELENGTCAQTSALRVRRGGAPVRGNTLRKTCGSKSITNESSSNISNKLRTINGKVFRMRVKGDGSRACMYPGGRKPIDFGVLWDSVDGEAMLGVSKMAALNILNGSQESSFMELPYYFHNLKLENEGTVTHIDTDDEGCFSVSQGETIETWSWFLTKLKECIGEDPNLVIISNRHYSITRNSKHGFRRHAKLTPCQKFERSIPGIKALRPEAYKKIKYAGFERWSTAYCPANKYNYLTSNCTESINALTKIVQKVPITNLMDYYRDLIQRAYDVKDNKTVHIVDLVKRQCSCLKWQLSGLPCGHVCAMSRCVRMKNCNKWEKWWFSKRTLKATYQELLYPLPDQNVWVTPNDLKVVLPPALVKPQPVRPKKKDKIKSKGEDQLIIRCSRCDTIGHSQDVCHSALPSQVSASQTMSWS